ncbi:hypothetical protein SBV1_2550004 [Verrucomicrobia bacterium]|nr:hypothetical protein SBV1_2550004 [Verrucomicrobiota bacterium]
MPPRPDSSGLAHLAAVEGSGAVDKVTGIKFSLYSLLFW